ncbi:MAG: sigma-70 family RNA polymerase sigma factor [Kiritimatiellae bacterium]|nr:sigma-70 family RNA polymerase sigma factor [Kiritimatiellia bacterium]
MKPDTKLFMQRLVDVQAELYCFVAALMVSNKSDVSDVVQETNRALIEHADDYDPSRPFTPWALTFARNQTLCHFKRCKRDRLVFDKQLVSRFAQEYARPDEEAHASPLARRLAFCLEKLSLRQRRLVALRYSEECRIDEIARQTGSRAAAVRAALFYIRKKLAECIASLCRTGREDFDMQGLSDFDALISDVIDGQAAPAELASLVPRLKESEECVAVYLAQMKVHALLSRRCLPGVCDLPAMVPVPAIRAGRQSWRYVLAAAAVALVVTGGWLAHQHQAGGGMPDLGRQSLAASQPVEVLFQWGSCNLALPDRLPGTLRLGNGHIKARLASGVEMLLLGPAVLNLVSAKEAKLVSGRIAIEVPPKTSGFTMYTRELEMWDI